MVSKASNQSIYMGPAETGGAFLFIAVYNDLQNHLNPENKYPCLQFF